MPARVPKTIRIHLTPGEYRRLSALVEAMHGPNSVGAWMPVSAGGCFVEGLCVRERLYTRELFRIKAHRWFRRGKAA